MSTNLTTGIELTMRWLGTALLQQARVVDGRTVRLCQADRTEPLRFGRPESSTNGNRLSSCLC